MFEQKGASLCIFSENPFCVLRGGGSGSLASIHAELAMAHVLILIKHLMVILK